MPENIAGGNKHPLAALAEEIRQINAQNGWNVTERSDWEGVMPAGNTVLPSFDEIHAACGIVVRGDALPGEIGMNAVWLAEHVPMLLAEISRLRDLVQAYKVPAVLALIHSEVSEALEAFRANDMQGFGKEMADTLMRVLDVVPPFCEDFDDAVHSKMATNRERGWRHGGKRV